MVVFPQKGRAQIISEEYRVRYDTNYVIAYKDELTARLYLSRKQNHYNLSERLLQPWMKYKTNENLLLGIGYTYSFLTLNLAVKIPFMNADDDIYGKSKYFDLQGHTTLGSYIIDFYLQWNTGYYIANPKDIYPSGWVQSQMPVRGDLRTHLLGLNLQYLFNSSRYSHKASFLQNEIQKRSAGSPILGIEAYWMLGMSDSALVGEYIHPAGYLDNQPFNRADIANAGVNGGYAYTFVWWRDLYLSLSSVFGLSCGYNQIHNTSASETIGSGLTMGFTNSTRISLGYNNPNYYIGISLNSFSMTNRVGDEGDWLGYRTGNIRINFAKRFITRRPIKVLRPDLWEFKPGQ